jgi:hypothetical protein
MKSEICSIAERLEIEHLKRYLKNDQHQFLQLRNVTHQAELFL